jgi:hypothetical protein
MMGRKDSENPAKEESILSILDGYRNDLHDKGVREKRAKVMKDGKVKDLVQHMSDRIAAAEGIGRVILLMDRSAVLYLWKSWAPCKECGELETWQIDREKGVSLPGWSKTVQKEPSGRIEMAKNDHEITVLQGSAELMHEMEKQGISPGRGYLFRSLNRDRTGFSDEPLKAAALKKRVQQHMAKADLFEGETLHSFERSAVQNAAEIEGFDVTKLVQSGQWSSYSAF